MFEEGGWVLSCADVKAHGLLVDEMMPNCLTQKTETLDPHIQKDGPKSVIEPCRIFQPENVKILRHCDGIKKKQQLKEKGTPKNSQKEAERWRQRSVNVSKNF